MTITAIGGPTTALDKWLYVSRGIVPGNVMAFEEAMSDIGPSDSDIDLYDEEIVECANCGGEGYVSHCFEEWACMHPDEGCDLCMRRCDWCNRPALPASTKEEQL